MHVKGLLLLEERFLLQGFKIGKRHRKNLLFDVGLEEAEVLVEIGSQSDFVHGVHNQLFG